MAEAEGGQNTSQSALQIINRTVFVENLRLSVEKLAPKMKALFSEKHGDSATVSLVRRRDGYEITFATAEATEDCIDNGLLIEGRTYDAVNVSNQELLVTLYPVPAYVEDSVIIEKMAELNCEVIGDVKHSQVQGIETGRRKIVAKLPPNTRSLPRALVLKTVNGKDERVELYHRNQRLRKSTR